MSLRLEQVRETANRILSSDDQSDTLGRRQVEALLKQLGFKDVTRSARQLVSKAEQRYSHDTVWQHPEFGDTVLITLPKKDQFSARDIEMVRAVLNGMEQVGTLEGRLTQDMSMADPAHAGQGRVVG